MFLKQLHYQSSEWVMKMEQNSPYDYQQKMLLTELTGSPLSGISLILMFPPK